LSYSMRKRSRARLSQQCSFPTACRRDFMATGCRIDWRGEARGDLCTCAQVSPSLVAEQPDVKLCCACVWRARPRGSSRPRSGQSRTSAVRYVNPIASTEVAAVKTKAYRGRGVVSRAEATVPLAFFAWASCSRRRLRHRGDTVEQGDGDREGGSGGQQADRTGGAIHDSPCEVHQGCVGVTRLSG